MHTEMAGRSVSDCTGHVIVLIADPHFRPNAVTITFGARQFQNEPGVVFSTDILPKLGRIAERRHYYVHSSVIVEVSKRAATMGARDENFGARIRRNIFKRSVTAI